MKIERETQVVRSSAPVQTVVGSEIVLMVLETGKCFGLGETGSDVWRLIEKPTTVTPVVDALGRIYDAPAELLETDVLELLSDLHRRGLIEVHPTS